MTQAGHPMVLEIANDTVKVSGFSSLLRSLQAAIRDVVGGTLLLDDYSQRHGPFLVTSIAGSSDARIVLQFWFADHENRPLWDTTHNAFQRFLREFEVALQRGNQRTFWGTPATAIVAGDYDDRMSRFIATLRTFGTATITYRNSVVNLQNGAIDLSNSRFSTAP